MTASDPASRVAGTDRVVELWPVVLCPVDLVDTPQLILIEGHAQQARRTFEAAGVRVASTTRYTDVTVSAIGGEMPPATRGWPGDGAAGVWLTLARGGAGGVHDAGEDKAAGGDRASRWERANRDVQVTCPSEQSVSRRVHVERDGWEIEPFGLDGGPLGYAEAVTVSLWCRGIGLPSTLELEATGMSDFLAGRLRWLAAWQ